MKRIDIILCSVEGSVNTIQFYVFTVYVNRIELFLSLNGETRQQNEKTCTRGHMTTQFRYRYQTLVIVPPINSKTEMS